MNDVAKYDLEKFIKDLVKGNNYRKLDESGDDVTAEVTKYGCDVYFIDVSDEWVEPRLSDIQLTKLSNYLGSTNFKVCKPLGVGTEWFTKNKITYQFLPEGRDDSYLLQVDDRNTEERPELECA